MSVCVLLPDRIPGSLECGDHRPQHHAGATRGRAGGCGRSDSGIRPTSAGDPGLCSTWYVRSSTVLFLSLSLYRSYLFINLSSIYLFALLCPSFPLSLHIDVSIYLSINLSIYLSLSLTSEVSFLLSLMSISFSLGVMFVVVGNACWCFVAHSRGFEDARSQSAI
jgi:hypothetical protein